MGRTPLERWTTLAAALLCAVFALATALLCHAISHFIIDDIWLFAKARTMPFWRYTFEATDVHPVPLHRLVSAALAWLAPMRFGASLAVLLPFHALGLVFLYRSLELVKRSPLNLVLLCWYGTNIYLGQLLQWWSAGLHRLPFIGFLGVAFYSYLLHRRAPTSRTALAVVGSTASALGFFEKGVLIPFFLVALEVSLGGLPRANRRGVLMLLGGLLVLSAAYFPLWRWIVGGYWSALTIDATWLGEHTLYSAGVLLTSAVAVPHLSPAVAIGVGLALVLSTAVRERRTLLTWAAAAVVLGLSLGVTGLSTHRGAMWGLSLALQSPRYYPDVMFVLVVFTGVALHQAYDFRWNVGERAGTARARAGWLGVAAALCAHAVMAYDGGFDVIDAKPEVRQSRAFIRRLAREVAGLRAEGREPIRLVDGELPLFIAAFDGAEARYATLLTAMAVDYTVVTEPRGAYRVTEEGRLEPAK